MSAVIGEDGDILASDYSAENRNHAPYLMPMIDSLLKQAGCTMRDIGLLGVTVGPGSFTGLRIGIATARGFTDLLDIPAVPLCSLDALAENYRSEKTVLVPVLDARKSQVYAAVYDNRRGEMKKILTERPVSPLEELSPCLEEYDDILFFGDAVPGWRERIEEFYGSRCRFGDEAYNGIRGEGLLRLTAAAREKEYTKNLMPVYLRGVDAKAKFADFVLAGMTENDIPELVELDKTCFPRPWKSGVFRDEINNPAARYWVLRTGGKITAYGGFWIVCDECHITNIAVHADYRHMGQGNAMMECLIRMAKLYGARSMTLEVRPTNITAISLYRHFGFEQEGRRKRYYEDNGEDALIMWLRFPETPEEKPWKQTEKTE